MRAVPDRPEPHSVMPMTAYRAAGLFLLLTALATAISVPARLAAGADATPVADALAQSLNVDAAEIARLEVSEKLSAIAAAKGAYGIGGAARLVGGLTLLAAGIALWRAMRSIHPTAMGIAATLLVASGIASAVSGAAAVALAVMLPEPEATHLYTYTTGVTASVDPKEALLTVRWVTGTIGFTLAGLALVALAPVQLRIGGILRATGVVFAVLGVAMLFIWLDAATVVHRITGVAFLIWLIVVGLWLVIPKLRKIGSPTPSSSP